MPGNVWTGGIYLRDEGGYEIVLKSLAHYRKRLGTLGKSPELQGAAAMFASVLHQQASKTVPEIDGAVGRIRDCLAGTLPVAELDGDVALIEKALLCYRSDIGKARDGGHEYFVGLVGDVAAAAQGDLAAIATALERIGERS